MQMKQPFANTVNLTHAVDMTLSRRDITNPMQIDTWAINTAQNSLMKYKMGLSPWQHRRERTVQIIAPQTIFREDCLNVTEPVNYVYCCFHAAEPFGLRKLIGPHGFAMIDDPHHLVLSRIKQIAKTYNEEGMQGWYKNQSQLYELLDLIKDVQPTEEEGLWAFPTNQMIKSSFNFVKQVHGKLWPKRHETLRVDELAQSLHISRSSLSHRYKKETGETLIETQLRWRIEESKRLLQLGQPIKLVADHLGFCDIYYFSKVFKKFVGMSPRNFRVNK